MQKTNIREYIHNELQDVINQLDETKALRLQVDFNHHEFKELLNDFNQRVTRLEDNQIWLTRLVVVSSALNFNRGDISITLIM